MAQAANCQDHRAFGLNMFSGYISAKLTLGLPVFILTRGLPGPFAVA